MKIGTQVQIIKYGHKQFLSKSRGVFLYSKDGIDYYDVLPELVGQRGEILSIEEINGETKYTLRGVIPKSGYYSADQLEEVF